MKKRNMKRGTMKRTPHSSDRPGTIVPRVNPPDSAAVGGLGKPRTKPLPIEIFAENERWGWWVLR